MTAVVVDHEDIPVDATPNPAAVAPMLGTAVPKKPKHDPKNNVNRPDNSRLTQQNLAKWEPMLTLNWSIAISFVVVATSALLGIAILLESQSMSSYRVVYDAGSHSDLSNHKDAVAVQEDGIVDQLDNCLLDTPDQANSFHADHTCFVNITLRAPIKGGRARVFYEINGFYQHHRRFVSSMDRTQFTDEWKPGIPITACEPVETIYSESCELGDCPSWSRKTRDLFPCGMVANTMFNDIFWLHEGVLPTGDKLGPKDLVARGAAREYTTPYKNPTWPLSLGDYLPVWRNPNFSLIIPPVSGNRVPYLASDYTNSTAWVYDPLHPEYGVGTGLENEHWRVWVETAAIEPFRKAYGFILRDELPEGTTLVFAVQSNFFVRSFGGSKAIVIAEVSWFGSDNEWLGGFFLAVAGVFALFMLFFLVRRCTNPRRMGDARALAWKKRM